jgi:hypothetical protein
MEEETNYDEGREEEDTPPVKKKQRTETMVLDDEEADLASALRPIRRTKQAESKFNDDETGSQDGGDSGVAVDDFSGDGAEFEENGVCLHFST